jgi:hypothetical protein
LEQYRLKGARERGYLKNLEDKRGKPARYLPDEPLPRRGGHPAAKGVQCTVHSPVHCFLPWRRRSGRGVRVCAHCGGDSERGHLHWVRRTA